MRCLRSLLALLLLAVSVSVPARAQGTRIKDLPLATTIPTDARLPIDGASLSAPRGITVAQLATNVSGLAIAGKLDATNGVAVGLTTPTVPTAGNSVVNKTALDAAIAGKLDTTNGVASGLTSSTLSSIAPNSVTRRQYFDTPGSTNIDNWMTIQTWGDSMTAGAIGSYGSTSYPAMLATYSGFRVVNGGVGGETTDQILARQTAASNTWSQPAIIWTGRNGIYGGTSNILAGIASMVANLASAGNTNRFLILPVFNSNTSGEWRGTALYTIVTNLSAILAATYPNNYIDARAYLISRYDPSNTNDVADFAHDVTPTSLRSDGGHLNDAGYATLAAYILTNGMPWLRGSWSSVVTPATVNATMRAPGPVGDLTPNTGAFTTLSASSASVSGAVTAGTVNASIGRIANLSAGDITVTNVGYVNYLRIGTPSTYKNIWLAGDGLSIQSGASIIASTDAAYDLGLNSSQYRFRNLYLSGSATAATGAFTTLSASSAVLSGAVTAGTVNATIGRITDLSAENLTVTNVGYVQFLRVGTPAKYKNIYLSFDGASVLFDGNLTAATDGGMNIGLSSTQNRPANIWATNLIQGRQIESTIATGTSPLLVASATKVASLNADLLDGLDSTAFQPASAALTNLAAAGTTGSGSIVLSTSPTLTNAILQGGTTVFSRTTVGGLYVGQRSAGLADDYFGTMLIEGASAANIAYQSRAAGGGANFEGLTSGGTYAAPTAPADAWPGVAFSGKVYDGSTYNTTARLVYKTSGTQSASNRGSTATLELTPNGSTSRSTTFLFGYDASLGLGSLTATNAVTGSRFVSTVATGTAPFTVASTTEVANLRAATATALSSGGSIGSNGTAITRIRFGRASAMVGGIIAVADAYVTANTRIILTVYTVGGTQGFLNTVTRTASTSFTITSSSILDTSVVDWVAFEP